MKNLFHLISFSIILSGILGALSSCEPCDDCGPENAYPYFTFSVMNRTSFDTLTVQRTRLREDITAIDEALDAEPTSSEEDSLNTVRTQKQAELDRINDLISDINGLIVSIDTLNNETGVFINSDGEDSLRSFRFPLDVTANTARYIMSIGGVRDTLEISYQLEQAILNNKISYDASDLSVEYYSFDSLRGPYGCNSEEGCISNELKIYVEI
jgi:hypothetical protein